MAEMQRLACTRRDHAAERAAAALSVDSGRGGKADALFAGPGSVRRQRLIFWRPFRSLRRNSPCSADQGYDFLVGNSLQHRRKLALRRYGDPAQTVLLMRSLRGLSDIEQINERISAAELSVYDLMDVLRSARFA